jgi:hypothetical protein
MAMGRQRARQGSMMVTWDELPKSPGHVFYDPLQAVLIGDGFDALVEELCKACHAPVMGALSLPPGRYFRMHLVGYFEASTASAAWSGAAPTACRCGISSASSCGRGSRTIPG